MNRENQNMMKNIELVDLAETLLTIQPDQSVHVHEIEPGASQTLEGMVVGMVTMDSSPPHNGECHNGGDEIIIVVKGEIAVTSDSNGKEKLALKAGGSCIIRQGEWHKIDVIEKAQLVYITPGLNNEHRF